MFGINSQAIDQNSPVNDYDQQLPAGGDDLLASGLNPSDNATSNPQDIPSSDPVGIGSNDDLINIKKDALQQLTPLVGHLEQTPDEKFRTTMMLIQATDDKSLLRSAYEAAMQIQDEKAKAQALLDVVNEINYFTHPGS
jgi:hypothetical protein